MKRQEMIDLLNNCYGEMLEPLKPELVPHYFHPGYQQTTDGQVSNYDDFVTHMHELKREISSLKILPFEEIVADDTNNKLCVRYTCRIERANGVKGSLPMFCMFEFADNKIIRVFEVSQPGAQEELSELATM